MRAKEFISESTGPSITVRDAKRALLAMGFEPTGRGKGSHDVWKDSSGLLFTIPVHGKDLEYGVAKTLLKLIRSRQSEQNMRSTKLVTERKKKKKRNRYFGGYFFPGYGYYGSGAGSSEGSAGDGGGESVRENSSSKSNVIFLSDTAAVVGQEHGRPLQLSDSDRQRIQAIADEHGAWYEGNGMDTKHTKGVIDQYQGSWDDDLLSSKIKGYPFQFLYVLFSNVKENDIIEGKIGFDPESSIFDRILDTQPSTNYFPDRQFGAETLEKFLRSVSEGPYDFVQMSQLPATEKNVRKFFTQGEKLMFPDNWEEYPYRAGRVAKSVNDLRDKFLATRKKGVYVAGSDHLVAVRNFLNQGKDESN
jgi:predicted RNA binding protein YcfA (HicA-like mRNA interferase family)